MTPAIVLGATGLVGGELLRLLHGHNAIDVVAAVSTSQDGTPIAEIFPHLAVACGEAKFAGIDAVAQTIADNESVALFSAAPHGASAGLVAAAVEAADKSGTQLTVVDVSADFRLRQRSTFERIYGVTHAAPQLLDQFHCSVPEHALESPVPHVAHPGCFATAILLAAIPLCAAGVVEGDLFVAATTGSTGSGRTPSPGTHHPERHSNIYAYKALSHRHAPEVQALITEATDRAPAVRFVPHSGPFARGIYATLQARLRQRMDRDALREVFTQYYGASPFVTITRNTPRLKNVVASNYAHLHVDSDGDSVAVSCAIDNLVKGAAGGAIQWMNRLLELPESTGLTAPAPAWT